MLFPLSHCAGTQICDEFTVAIDDGKKAHPKKFEFDICFPPESSQEQVYEETQVCALVGEGLEVEDEGWWNEHVGGMRQPFLPVGVPIDCPL